MLRSQPFLSICLALSCFITSALQVDIVMASAGLNFLFDLDPSRGYPSWIRGMVCPSHPPGVCCMVPTGDVGYEDVVQVSFNHLTAFDIAAIWRERRTDLARADGRTVRIRGCSGTVMASKRGPGQWRWDMTRDIPIAFNRHFATGASYISVPKSLPPDAATGTWLDMQGVLGLVWGGGKWFASAAVENVLGEMVLPQRSVLQPRDIHSPKTGQMYARPPLVTVFPIVDIDGTNYTHSSTNNEEGIMYRNSAGDVLNLTTVFING
ncbi:MAG: hypothetical protein Q9224_005811 [Gallowayella concinna]